LPQHWYNNAIARLTLTEIRLIQQLSTDSRRSYGLRAIHTPAAHVSACTTSSSSRGSRIIAHGILDSYRKERGLPLPTEEAQTGNSSTTTTTTTATVQQKPQPSIRSWVEGVRAISAAVGAVGHTCTILPPEISSHNLSVINQLSPVPKPSAPNIKQHLLRPPHCHRPRPSPRQAAPFDCY